jgi:hypothetical protein
MADDSVALVPSTKRQRTDDSAALVAADSRALAAIAAGGVPRTSSLDAPIMKLTGALRAHWVAQLLLLRCAKRCACAAFACTCA